MHQPPNDTSVFQTLESNVRSYCRSFPVVFARAKGAELFDESGRRYIDFFAGAGALNYGHNPDALQDALVAYLRADQVVHALDMYTTAKRAFLERFSQVILEPRRLPYKVQFCGPTGANAVEAALKLARLATGRTNVCSFSGGWHGMTAGCLAVTANRAHRKTAGAPAANATVVPFPVGPRPFPDALAHLENLLDDPSSGLDTPAAFLIETAQCEGGIYVAPPEFLQGLRALCDRHGILLIVDDIQAGCGRTGTFFSFEPARIVPDVVCLSKSIGGYGLPMSLVLMKRELDVWEPGQHTGTFRGHQLAFVAAAGALSYWQDETFARAIARKGELVKRTLEARLGACFPGVEIRGRGLLLGLDVALAGGSAAAEAIRRLCFERGLIVETSGRDDTVLKILPPLVIEDSVLAEGLEILVSSTEQILSATHRLAAHSAALPGAVGDAE